MRCGEVAIAVSNAGLHALETMPLAWEGSEQTVPPHAVPTEEMPAIIMPRKEQEEQWTPQLNVTAECRQSKW